MFVFLDSTQILCFLPVILTAIFKIIKFEASIGNWIIIYSFHFFLNLGAIYCYIWFAHYSTILKSQLIHYSSKILNIKCSRQSFSPKNFIVFHLFTYSWISINIWEIKLASWLKYSFYLSKHFLFWRREIYHTVGNYHINTTVF